MKTELEKVLLRANYKVCWFERSTKYYLKNICAVCLLYNGQLFDVVNIRIITKLNSLCQQEEPNEKRKNCHRLPVISHVDVSHVNLCTG
jgi:hypothetical protein